ncbi:MAG TPA: zinc dependent phospholipase C family protein [Bryobacteraceae bacterium]|nr:zinc dependent phospholipase C family protein [Bryobacteraceae bacterium]
MRRPLVCFFALLWTPGLHAYSVLTHEAIIDSAWDQNIKPLLLQRFPNASPEDLRGAHAYAYAGCIIQDMGYYPFGSKFFSDLLHYARSGDFVTALVRDSQSLDEYAFALGALAHYAADTEGHSIAVNPSVGLEYLKLREKFGPIVTYEDDPIAHMSVEFGFDVIEIALNHYAPQAYHDFIGFKVSRPLLERAFRETYGLEMTDVFSSEDTAIGTYRRTVSKIIPEMTKVAWDLHKKDLVKSRPGLTRRRFIYNIRRASFEKEWGDIYQRPGIFARFLAILVRILPKAGPIRIVTFKKPTSRTMTLFEESFNRTLTVYRGYLSRAGQGQLVLENRDFDTGAPTRPGEYELADETYAKLAIALAGRDPATLDSKLVENVCGYFRNLSPADAAGKDRKLWTQTIAAVEKLRGLSVAPETRLPPD